MDTSIVVALITAAATIVSALITAVTTPHSTQNAPVVRIRSWRFGAITLALTAVLAVAALYASRHFVVEALRTFPQNQLLPGARYDSNSSFDGGDVLIEHGPFKLSAYPVYVLDQSQGKRTNSISFNELFQITSMPPKVGGGFIVANFYAPQETTLNGKGVKLILRVERDDMIELKLTDRYKHDPWVHLKVRSGWAEYDVPYTAFSPHDLDLARVEEFHVGFSAATGRAPDSNVMELASIDTYD